MLVPVCLRTDSAIAGVPLRIAEVSASFSASIDLGDVAHLDRVVAELADDDVADLVGLQRAALDAQRGVERAALDRAARDVDVAGGDRALDLERRDPGRGEPDRVEVDVDLAVLAAEDHDLPDAGQPLDPLLDLLVGEPGQLADRHARSGP